jgi:hypothetical protein
MHKRIGGASGGGTFVPVACDVANAASFPCSSGPPHHSLGVALRHEPLVLGIWDSPQESDPDDPAEFFTHRTLLDRPGLDDVQRSVF